jgi:nucleolar protein 12
MPKPVPASPVEGVATAAAGPSTNKKRSADAIGPKTIKKAKAAPGAAKTGSESEVSATLPAASGTSKASVKEAGGEEEDVDEDSSDEDDGDISKLVHETVAGTAKKPKVKAVKYVPADETPTDKARRSLFIGNLPVECVNSKKGDRQLIAHLLTFAPTAKVESVRFRSIAFKNPTSGVPGEEGESKIKKRESERASAWKAEQAKLKAGGKEAEEADAAKTFLDAKGKRKVAFIKKNVRVSYFFGRPMAPRDR